MTDLTMLLLAVAVIGAAVTAPMRTSMRLRQERRHLASVDVAATDASRPRRGSLTTRLRAAGLIGPAEAYVFTASVCAALVGLMVARWLPSVPMAALVAAGIAVYLPWVGLTALVRRRARTIEHQLIGTVDLTITAIEAGGHLVHALQAAAPATPQPLRRELEDALRHVSMGMPLERAFGGLADRYSSEGLRLFAVALSAKLRAGGDLAPLLRALNETLRDSWRLRRQVRAQLSGARASTIGVIALPYLLAVALAWLRPHWFDGLFTADAGRTMFFIAFTLQLAGVLWFWRILTRDV